MRKILTFTIHHFFLYLFCQKRHSILNHIQILQLPSLVQKDLDHQEAILDQAIPNPLAVLKNRFFCYRDVGITITQYFQGRKYGTK